MLHVCSTGKSAMGARPKLLLKILQAHSPGSAFYLRTNLMFVVVAASQEQNKAPQVSIDNSKKQKLLTSHAMTTRSCMQHPAIGLRGSEDTAYQSHTNTANLALGHDNIHICAERARNHDMSVHEAAAQLNVLWGIHACLWGAVTLGGQHLIGVSSSWAESVIACNGNIRC